MRQSAPRRPCAVSAPASSTRPTWSRTAAARFVLQRVNPIFPVGIHRNIEAVTEHLHARGLLTPRLLPDARRASCAWSSARQGVWRLMTYVDGVSFDVIAAPEQARAAGALVGRFHRALESLDHDFAERRRGAHDTPRHLERLREALAAPRRAPPVRHRGGRWRRAMLERAAALPPLPALPERVCHGDLKFNNVLFAAGAGRPLRRPAVPHRPRHRGARRCWRSSWATPGAPGATATARTSPRRPSTCAILAASLEGYRAGLGRPLSPDEAPGAAAGPGVGEPRAGGPLRHRRPRRELLRLGPRALRRPRRPQPGARPGASGPCTRRWWPPGRSGAQLLDLE